MAGKAALFLDAGYLDKVLEFHGRLRIDYERFSDALCEPDERFRTYYYNCPPWQGNPPSDDDRARLSSYQAFAHRLNLLNRFVVREGRLQKIGDRFRQKGVDMLLAVDLLRLAYGGRIDRMLLLTADSDFVPAIEAARDTGVVTSLVYAPSLNVHNSLLSAVDERLRLEPAFLESHVR